MSKISICMIAKNEAELLPRALADWRALADELIIVDTGSTDRTVAIARELGARVLHYDWRPPGHKGAARNLGLDLATGDWVVVLDADEIIGPKAALRAFLLSETAQDYTAFNVTFNNFDEANRVTLAWQQIRIFRRTLYCYQHREHEMPYPLRPETVAESFIDVVFEHRPPPDRAQGKTQPMIDRLALDVAERPGDPHPLYFLHRQYCIAGEWDEALQLGREYLSVAARLGIDPCECHGNMAVAHLGNGQRQEAISHLHAAAALQPERRIWWIRLAEIYHGQGQNNIALALCRLAAELWPTPEANAQPYTNGAHLYEFMQHCQEAMLTGNHHHG